MVGIMQFRKLAIVIVAFSGLIGAGVAAQRGGGTRIQPGQE